MDLVYSHRQGPILGLVGRGPLTEQQAVTTGETREKPAAVVTTVPVSAEGSSVESLTEILVMMPQVTGRPLKGLHINGFGEIRRYRRKESRDCPVQQTL